MKTYTLKNEFHEITILEYGATVHTWYSFKEKINIVISNKNLEDYLIPENGYFGATVGRFANRIRDGKFTLNNKEYQLAKNFSGGQHGHGGYEGFNKKKFELVSFKDNELVLSYFSKDMEEGYPGNLDFKVTYKLDGTKLIVKYHATTDKDTIINIVNHAHFNLSNEPNILNHSLYLPAKYVLETDKDLVLTGNLKEVKNTPFDFNTFTPLKDVLFKDEVRLYANGLDHSFLFDKEHVSHLKYKNKNLKITSTYPGTQAYSMNNPINQPLLDRVFEYHAGIAFEHQYEPNAINIPNFSDVILRKGDEYNEEVIYDVFED